MTVYQMDLVQTKAIDPYFEIATVFKVESHLKSDPFKILLVIRFEMKTC
jgi:hypothetical protein